MSNKVKIGQTISLCTAERKLAHFVARNRNRNNRSFNRISLKISESDQATVDLEGVCGELAFCKLFNAYPDLDTDRPPPHPLFDCMVDGLRIDVKTTRWETGKLIVDARKGRKTRGVDYYALMTGQFPGPYTFRGFIARERLIVPSRLGTLAHYQEYQSYIAEQSELTDEIIANPSDCQSSGLF